MTDHNLALVILFLALANLVVKSLYYLLNYSLFLFLLFLMERTFQIRTMSCNRRGDSSLSFGMTLYDFGLFAQLVKAFHLHTTQQLVKHLIGLLSSSSCRASQKAMSTKLAQSSIVENGTFLRHIIKDARRIFVNTYLHPFPSRPLFRLISGSVRKNVPYERITRRWEGASSLRRAKRS